MPMKTNIDKLFDIDFIFSTYVDTSFDLSPFIDNHCALCMSTDIFNDNRCELCNNDHLFQLIGFHLPDNCPNEYIVSTNKLCNKHYIDQVRCTDCVLDYDTILLDSSLFYPLDPCSSKYCKRAVCLLHSYRDDRSCYNCESTICKRHILECARCNGIFCENESCFIVNKSYCCSTCINNVRGLCHHCFDYEVDSCQICGTIEFTEQCSTCHKKTCFRCKVKPFGICPSCDFKCINCSKSTKDTCSLCDSYMCKSCSKDQICRRCKK
jgi:hypothetical protein